MSTEQNKAVVRRMVEVSIETQMSVDSEVSGMTYAARIAYMVLAWLFVVALLAQVYLIGLVFLAAQPTLDAHVGFGHTVGILLLPMLILTYVARHPRSRLLEEAARRGPFDFTEYRRQKEGNS